VANGAPPPAIDLPPQQGSRLHSHLFVLGLEACGLRSDYGAAAPPLLLRGEHLIEDAGGNVHRTSRPVSAVCRCGKSASQP